MARAAGANNACNYSRIRVFAHSWFVTGPRSLSRRTGIFHGRFSHGYYRPLKY